MNSNAIEAFFRVRSRPWDFREMQAACRNRGKRPLRLGARLRFGNLAFTPG